MKSLKKCFSLAGGRKSVLSFARLLCGLVMLTVPLCTSCGQKKVDVQKVLGKENYKASELMIAVPGQNFSILATEVTQELYETVMGENPSEFKGEKNLPVENVSWVDAVAFCNELSVKEGLKPCYSYKENTNAAQWGLDNNEMSDWSENKWKKFNKNFACDTTADGYRLPTVAEWLWAAMGGQVFKCSGSDNLDEVGWYYKNSEEKTHPVVQKKPNGYGLYDMSGNVWEWCGDLDEYFWDFDPDYSNVRYNCGGGWSSNANITSNNLGFRIVRSSSKK
ncbi:MAG: SUMF1/EgtB/PvdO family nonheme iron enzyme [Treponema succinifaciens]|uniref:formylglycine-generating enzyme family protein n=1 Tax=Treponema TaxID=157 RepID=UPI0023F3330E|nr:MULTISPECIES: SUMF1/EgtB/PvdO family nonheme iron enzyme [Treponema]MDD6962105.1 SUMF1/EgtB/PvdO family nonheme iron enzyme [Treponema succinifaciens]MDY5117449.1 SUMF1/EgtB/PvdO family nonheme iron enzyme [Treponema succinifaciens]